MHDGIFLKSAPLIILHRKRFHQINVENCDFYLLVKKKLTWQLFLQCGRCWETGNLFYLALILCCCSMEGRSLLDSMSAKTYCHKNLQIILKILKVKVFLFYYVMLMSIWITCLRKSCNFFKNLLENLHFFVVAGTAFSRSISMSSLENSWNLLAIYSPGIFAFRTTFSAWQHFTQLVSVYGHSVLEHLGTLWSSKEWDNRTRGPMQGSYSWADGLTSLSEKTRKLNHLQMLEQRQHFFLNYFKTLSGGPAGNRTRDLPHSGLAPYQLG